MSFAGGYQPSKGLVSSGRGSEVCDINSKSKFGITNFRTSFLCYVKHVLALIPMCE